MANKLFSLFEDKLRTPQDLVASTPQNLQSIGQQVEDPTAILRMIQQFEVVRPKADYRDFSKFVFFNSALDYFNLTGEKILNSYPYDASSADLQFWMNSLDEYQRYTVGVWPKSEGHLRFDPANGFAYILADDVWKDGDVTRTSLLSPGTGSLSIEFWTVPPPALTGTNDAMIVMQKVTGSTSDGYTVYFSGSSVFFSLVSGSTSEQVQIPTTAGTPAYYCFSYDKTVSPPIIRAFSGSTTSFPVLASYFTSSIEGNLNGGTSRVSIGSGSSGKLVRPLTGSLDDIRVWNASLSLSEITSSFNTRIAAQDGLSALWRFNETGSLPTGQREVVKDASGHRMNGIIRNYYASIRGSGSILPFDQADLVMSMDEPVVGAYITQQQLSGNLYDKYNDNLITRMLPEQFFILEEYKETTVLRDFLYVIARYFDNLKVMIDQFAHILKNDYGRYDNTPDAILQDIGKFFGWEFTGTFLNSDAIQYILGKQVLPNLDYNKTIDTKLYEIKNEFWKRTLINLMHLYKTKGTRESVEAVLRIYGANKNFIRLKEYGYKPNAGIQTFRVNAEKSTYVLELDGAQRVWNDSVSSTFETVECRVKFPTETSTGLTASLATGSIFEFKDNTTVAGGLLYFTKTGATSTTGSLIFTGSAGRVELASVPIFDNEWYNIVVRRNQVSSSISIDVRHLDENIIDYHASASLTTSVVTTAGTGSVQLGLSRTGVTGSQMWAQELRVWGQVLDDRELDDHTLNFQSYGTQESDGDASLDVHWRLNDNVAVDGSGGSTNFAQNYSTNPNAGVSLVGQASGFTASETPFTKYLLDYNYIASPEYGWTEEKVRVISGSSVTPDQAFQDNPMVALEFNLTDALNEDISQIVSSLDGFNEFVGSPADAYRDSYEDLETLRKNYFMRLRGAINFRVFADLLEFFDRSFVDMVRRLIPARATFLGDEFVVESHMLERPKVQWNYRRQESTFQPEGVITIYIRS